MRSPGCARQRTDAIHTTMTRLASSSARVRHWICASMIATASRSRDGQGSTSTPCCASSLSRGQLRSEATGRGVCCVLPFAGPAVAASGLAGVLAWFAGPHAWATALASVIVSVEIGRYAESARSVCAVTRDRLRDEPRNGGLGAGTRVAEARAACDSMAHARPVR